MATLKDLKANGGFISAHPVKKEISYVTQDADGNDQEYSASIFVKRLSVGDYEALFLSEKEESSRTAKLISETITLGEDGKEKIDFKLAYTLHPSLAGAMVQAFNEVNLSKKASRPVTGSSAN